MFAVAVVAACSLVVPPQIITNVRSLADRYDAFLLDQFGVLHNGREAIPGATECFAALAAAGKQLIVLSNTSRRRADALGKLPRLGFDASALRQFVGSGEQAWQFLATPECAGKRVLWLCWDDDYLGFDNKGYLDGLDVSLAPAESCDYVLAQGTQLMRGGGADVAHSLLQSGVIDAHIEEALATCIERGVTMLCANPDFVATQPDGTAGHMPGVLARHYERLGGAVVHFGKPHRGAFDAALLELEGEVPAERVCHVGDSLAHDIAGANRAGIHSLFIGAGIHAAELGLEPPVGDAASAPLDATALEALLARASEEEGEAAASPSHAASTFVW